MAEGDLALVVERDENLDGLHWRMTERTTPAFYRLSIACGNLRKAVQNGSGQEVVNPLLQTVDQSLAGLEGALRAEMAELDSFIPGGCPDDRPTDSDD